MGFGLFDQETVSSATFTTGRIFCTEEEFVTSKLDFIGTALQHFEFLTLLGSLGSLALDRDRGQG